MRNIVKYSTGLLAVFLLFTSQPVWAAGPPAPSLFSNPLAITFLVLMFLLLIVIGILANIMIGAADVKLKKRLAPKGNKTAALVSFLLFSTSLFAQDPATAGATKTAAKSIAGMDATAFYIMVTVLFLELVVIIAMLVNIKFLLKQEKENWRYPLLRRRSPWQK